MANFTFPPHYLLPVGFRFRPTEEELITHYLKNKILGQESLVQYIREIDLYEYDPWKLPEQSIFQSDNYEWFFFRDNASKTKRTTPTGNWKPTGEDRPIMARGTNKVIATRKILVFYKTQDPKAVKTNWVIHEYHLHSDTNISYQRPFVICRLKENAEKRDVSTCDQDTQTSTVDCQLKKKGTQRPIQELNGGAQASGQSVLQPPWHSTRQLALADFPPVNVNKQPIQAPASEDEVSLTELLNSLLDPDEHFDDATSKMSKSPWCSEPEPALMDFQPSSDQSLHPEDSKTELNFSELLLNSILMEDENCDEVTLNNRIDSYNEEELDSMVYELQGGICSSDTDTDTNFGFPVLQNNHISPSWLHECTRSIIKKSRRSSLTVKHFQYKEEKDELRGNSSVLFGEGKAQNYGTSIDSDNPDPGPTFKAQRQPKSSNVVAYGGEPKRIRLKKEILSKTMPQDKAKEDEKHIETVDSPQLSVTYSNSGVKGDAGNKATKSGVSCCGSIKSTRNCFSYILTTKRIHHKSSLPVFYFAKAFLGIIILIMFAQEVLLHRHSRC
ncbi:NAC domain-containing protein 3-like [Benincasa hispida]|uniref:NAC domain-containing protein 3-like n=1 Tax=Benincasa hispida TaxID=102211 RepID=UPI001901BBC5|nr:NAC domain-containing protein 3-like [Benincasa hispida]